MVQGILFDIVKMYDIIKNIKKNVKEGLGVKRISAILISILLVLLCTVTAFAEDSNNYYSVSFPSEWKEDTDVSEYANSDFVEQRIWNKTESQAIELDIQDNELNINMSNLGDSVQKILENRFLENLENERDSEYTFKVTNRSSEKIKCGDYDSLRVDADYTVDMHGMSVDAKAHEYIFTSKNHIFYFGFVCTNTQDLPESERLDILSTFKINEEMPSASLFSNNDSESRESSVGSVASDTFSIITIVVIVFVVLCLAGLVIALAVIKSKSKRNNTPANYPQQMPVNPQQYNQQGNTYPNYNQMPQYGQQNNTYPRYNQNANYVQNNYYPPYNQNQQYGQNINTPPSYGFDDEGNQPTKYLSDLFDNQ